MSRDPYPGGKGNVYHKLINMMPPHRTYIETHLGAGSVMAAKRPALANIGIELNPVVLRETVRVIEPGTTIINVDDYRPASPSMTLGAEADRNSDECLSPSFAFINGDCVEYLRGYPFRGDELTYFDPPYKMDTRKRQSRIYDYEYDDDDHVQMLNCAKSMNCMVMISGYFSQLYADMLSGWRSVSFQAVTRGGSMATEWVWMNYPAPTKLHDYQYLGDDYRERERIRKKKSRWVRKLQTMELQERQAIMWAIQEAGLS